MSTNENKKYFIEMAVQIMIKNNSNNTRLVSFMKVN